MICKRFDELVKSLVGKISQRDQELELKSQSLQISLQNTEALKDEIVVYRQNQERLQAENQSLKDLCDDTLEEERFYYE